MRVGEGWSTFLSRDFGQVGETGREYDNEVTPLSVHTGTGLEVYRSTGLGWKGPRVTRLTH